MEIGLWAKNMSLEFTLACWTAFFPGEDMAAGGVFKSEGLPRKVDIFEIVGIKGGDMDFVGIVVYRALGIFAVGAGEDDHFGDFFERFYQV